VSNRNVSECHIPKKNALQAVFYFKNKTLAGHNSQLSKKLNYLIKIYREMFAGRVFETPGPKELVVLKMSKEVEDFIDENVLQFCEKT
jgi:hypothetical protein